MRTLTDLDGAILGILSRESLSGYAIRKLFTTTPLAGYSDSPGSIYPALRRLEKQGLVVVRTQRTSALDRRVHQITTPGKTAFRDWVGQAPTLHEIESWPDGVLLRFAFADAVLTRRQIAEWLAQMEKHTLLHLTALETFRDVQARDYERCGALALDAGVSRYQSLLEWTRSARKEFTR